MCANIFSQLLVCINKLMPKKINEFNNQLASTRVFEKKWKMLNFDEELNQVPNALVCCQS